MTFNIRYANADDGENRWELRRELLYQVIREEKPEVLGLQEALKIQLEEMQNALPEYTSVGVGRDDGISAGEHAPIFFLKERFQSEEHGTFWFSDTPDIPGSKHWGNRITRICTWVRLQDRMSGRLVCVYNLHLDHESQPSRLKSVELLLKRIQERRDKDPVVVMGDLNADEDNPAVVAIMQTEQPKMRDTFRVVYPKAEDVGTFHNFSVKPEKEKIDYLFVSPEFHVMDAAILRANENGRYPSDHFPVTAHCLLQEDKAHIVPPS